MSRTANEQVRAVADGAIYAIAAQYPPAAAGSPQLLKHLCFGVIQTLANCHVTVTPGKGTPPTVSYAVFDAQGQAITFETKLQWADFRPRLH